MGIVIRVDGLHTASSLLRHILLKWVVTYGSDLYYSNLSVPSAGPMSASRKSAPSSMVGTFQQCLSRTIFLYDRETSQQVARHQARRRRLSHQKKSRLLSIPHHNKRHPSLALHVNFLLNTQGRT